MRPAAGFGGAVLLLAFLMAGCDSTAPSGRIPDLGPDESALAQSNNAFAFDLYAKLREQKGNLFLSPYSISSALAMTSAGRPRPDRRPDGESPPLRFSPRIASTPHSRTSEQPSTRRGNRRAANSWLPTRCGHRRAIPSSRVFWT